MAFMFLSFSAFGGEENHSVLKQKLCGAVLSSSVSDGPISLQIRGGKALINESYDRDLLERVSAKYLRDFDLKGRSDDLEFLLATTLGQNLLLSKAISPLIRTLHWKSIPQNPYSESTMVLSATIPAQDPIEGASTFQIYDDANQPSNLYGQVFLQFSSLKELEAAIGSLNSKLMWKADNLRVVIDPARKTLLVTEMDLYSSRGENNFINFINYLDFGSSENGGVTASGVRLFIYFLKKYGAII